MFDDDAVLVSRLLNLTLTHRIDSPMCGIPYHAAKIYIARLLRLGKKIAICEQVGEVCKGKGLTERKITEIITPGTAIDSEYLEMGSANYLACLSVSGEMAKALAATMASAAATADLKSLFVVFMTGYFTISSGFLARGAVLRASLS